MYAFTLPAVCGTVEAPFGQIVAPRASREAELEIKRADQAATRWKSPIIVAILAAAVAGLSNTVVSYFNASAQTRLEAQKSEQARILEMIKTGSADKAAENLQFLVDAGLIRDPTLRADLTRFLEGRKKGSGPSLPSATISKDLSELVSKYEGAVLKPIKVGGMTLIGSSHALSEDELRTGTIKIAGVEVPYSQGITEEQARQLLEQDLQPFRAGVDAAVKVPVTQNQRDSLVSFAFQVGMRNFRNSSVLKKLNAGQYDQVPEELKRWSRAGGVEMPGIAARREAEVGLWTKP